MKRLLPLLMALPLLSLCAPALANDGALRQCRSLNDAAPRLACYDAIKLPGTPALGAPPVAAAPVGAPPVAAVPVNAPVAAPTPAAREQSFGLRQAKADELQSISSTIAGHFDGWRKGTPIKLANGQVWRVADDSEDDVSGTDLKVKIERNIFGATFLVVEGTNKSPRVKRVQ